MNLNHCMHLLQVCNWQIMLCMLDYEFVCRLRTGGSTLVPVDTTSAQLLQTDLLRCKEKGKEQPERLLNLKDWLRLTGGEVLTAFALMEIHEMWGEKMWSRSLKWQLEAVGEEKKWDA